MKFAYFLLFFVITATCTYSQSIIYGVKAGLNLSTFTGNDVESAKLQPSFHVGGFVNFLITEKITVQPEIFYSGKGAKFDLGNYRLGYISVPVLAQYNDPSGFFAEVGPQASLRLTAKRKTGQTTDIKNEIKSADFSWVVGLGYKSPSGIGVGARYDFGYYNVANAGIIRNKTILISIMYTFGAAEE